MSEIVIETRKLTKEFVRDSFHVVALKEVDLAVHRGEFFALMGPSGSGKSTLLHLIAAMDRPSSGEIRALGQDLNTLDEGAVARWRNRHIGFAFQTVLVQPKMEKRRSPLENIPPFGREPVPNSVESSQRRLRLLYYAASCRTADFDPLRIASRAQRSR